MWDDNCKDRHRWPVFSNQPTKAAEHNQIKYKVQDQSFTIMKTLMYLASSPDVVNTAIIDALTMEASRTYGKKQIAL